MERPGPPVWAARCGGDDNHQILPSRRLRTCEGLCRQLRSSCYWQKPVADSVTRLLRPGSEAQKASLSHSAMVVRKGLYPYSCC